MKLKKIASLALAGLMAVSMLAGCNNGNSGSSSSEGSTVVTVSAADAMNAVQDVAEFKTSATLDAWLASAAKKATYDMLDKATVAGGMVTAGAVYDQLGQAMTSNATYTIAKTLGGLKNNPAAAEKSRTELYLYLIDDVTSEESAVNAIGRNVFATVANYPDFVNATKNSGANQVTGSDATYTGEVSVAKVSKTNEEGKTASAYYVLVAVTQSAGKAVTVTLK